ncbi:MAG: methanol--corrinoid methyltransferase [Deltaproteobacteria bacterium]|jgi:methanol--5-hydroxybenzimidazolylcobamide Co-methyltransferase|nr:methanol--corrinoid methyltransferase [Deltaproteobacteria bacterium]
MLYKSLAISNPDDLIFGTAPKPVVTRNYGLVIGGGTLYPELNFTVPTMKLEPATLKEMYGHYEQIVREALKRAGELESPGVVLECETLPQQTEFPEWSETIAKILLEGMAKENARSGLKSALRFTPNDNRDMIRPPLMRSGYQLERMLETFERVTKAGADLISIESIGGKETHDESLIHCAIDEVIFALSILATRDMKFLWGKIVEICKKNGATPAGDSCCGFANTAMVLAEQKLIPNSFSAVVRVLGTVRAIVAIEEGAKGPGKDCAYENPFLKVITGNPSSGEGKTAACAHLSPLGNIAAAYTDLWSNESVQNIMLLGSTAPTAYMEQLIYDCRLYNGLKQYGHGKVLRDMLVRSDAPLDSRAFVFRPENVVLFGKTIVESKDYYDAAKNVSKIVAQTILTAGETGGTRVSKPELKYLKKIIDTVDALPKDEGAFIEKILAKIDKSKLKLEEYGL